MNQSKQKLQYDTKFACIWYILIEIDEIFLISSIFSKICGIDFKVPETKVQLQNGFKIKSNHQINNGGVYL